MSHPSTDRAAVLLALLLAAAPAQPQSNPCTQAGTRLVRETNQAWHCLPVSLPRISPGFFVSDTEVGFARAQLGELALKKKRYQDQLAALKRMRGGLELAARDLDAVRHEIVMDNMSHALNVIAWSAGDLLREPARQALLTEITVLKGYVNAAAAAHSAPDSERRYEKAIDAAFNFKNVVLNLSSAMAPAQAEAFKRASDTLPKMLKVSQRFAQPNPDKSTWELAAATADDTVAAVGEFVGVLKAARSTVHMLGGEVAMWHIERSKASLDEAFAGSQTAKRYYLQKIAENDEMQAFYRERIRRADIR
jgi:hypothetical protein